ncbi:MAG: motility protein A [Planctomycetota bacterium]|jgi:chemotaxis protein MotA
MDIATIVGILFGFLVISLSIIAGGGGAAFVHIPSMAIVVGGMLCATLIHFSLSQFLSIFSVIKKTIMVRIPLPSETIQQMVNYAAVNRRDGSLALEEHIRKVNDKFMSKGLQMLVDGQEEDWIRDMMGLEIQYRQERHKVGKKILEYMGSAAPAFGMIGTLIGLVTMLKNLTNPESLGAGMAVALITTFYGAFLANLIFIPLGGKLGLYSQAEIQSMEMIMEGICAISRGENPTGVREKLQAFVSPNRREDIKATM